MPFLLKEFDIDHQITPTEANRNVASALKLKQFEKDPERID